MTCKKIDLQKSISIDNFNHLSFLFDIFNHQFFTKL